MSSVLLRHEGPTLAVRVAPGRIVECVDDHAPGARETFGPGDLIPDLDREQALVLIEAGDVVPAGNPVIV